MAGPIPNRTDTSNKQVAGAGFGGLLLICLLKLTLYKKSLAHSLQFGRKLRSTFITVWVEVSYLFRFNPGANYRAHGPQLRDGGLILYWRRIRKLVT